MCFFLLLFIISLYGLCLWCCIVCEVWVGERVFGTDAVIGVAHEEALEGRGEGTRQSGGINGLWVSCQIFFGRG